jgi:hypothetical protein
MVVKRLLQQGIIWGERMEKGENRAVERLLPPFVKTQIYRLPVTARH